MTINNRNYLLILSILAVAVTTSPSNSPSASSESEYSNSVSPLPFDMDNFEFGKLDFTTSEPKIVRHGNLPHLDLGPSAYTPKVDWLGRIIIEERTACIHPRKATVQSPSLVICSPMVRKFSNSSSHADTPSSASSSRAASSFGFISPQSDHCSSANITPSLRKTSRATPQLDYDNLSPVPEIFSQTPPKISNIHRKLTQPEPTPIRPSTAFVSAPMAIKGAQAPLISEQTDSSPEIFQNSPPKISFMKLLMRQQSAAASSKQSHD